jgi:hypothetical protein
MKPWDRAEVSGNSDEYRKNSENKMARRISEKDTERA